MTFLWSVAPATPRVHSWATKLVNLHGTYAVAAACCSLCHADWMTPAHAPPSHSSRVSTPIDANTADCMAGSVDRISAHWALAPYGLAGSYGMPARSVPHPYAAASHSEWSVTARKSSGRSIV